MRIINQVQKCVSKIKLINWSRFFQVYFYFILAWIALGFKVLPTIIGYKEWSDYQNTIYCLILGLVISTLVITLDHLKSKYKYIRQ